MRLVLLVLLVLSLNMFSSKSFHQFTSMRRSLRFSNSFVRSTTTTTSIVKSSSSSSFKNGNKVMLALGLAAGFASSYHSSIALQMTSGSEGGKDADKFGNTALYPLGNLIEKGRLQVSDKHNISYTVYGNPKGKPALFVHGGPGGGTSPEMSRFFDPKYYKIILVDQRGCGESTPFANLEENTTFDLVRDFEKLRVKLGIEKWLVFGGSWGSTLALTYAIQHPERVTQLVLRGIFLLRKKEIDWFYQSGASYIYPEDWAAYEEAIPVNERDDYLKAYGKRLRGELGEEEMRKAAKAWSIWEGRTSKLVQDPWETVKERFGADDFSLAFARIENHYFTNKGFFPSDGWLLEKQNIDKIKHIPTVVVQGRYEEVCPAVSAYQLKQTMHSIEMHYTLTGHSGFETEIIKRLVEATDKFKLN
jgi:proline iminopeptidase